MTVDILGSKYEILYKNYDEEESFKRCGICGFCEALTRKIVICNMDTFAGWEHESEKRKRAEEKLSLRHEIVHAFFNESGLCSDAHRPDGSFALDEELVDWIAQQGPKIYKAWESAKCLP